MKWPRILLIILLAAIAFGGTFTCNSHDGDNSTTVNL